MIKFIIKELPQLLQGPIRKFFEIVQIPVFGLLKKFRAYKKKKKEKRKKKETIAHL